MPKRSSTEPDLNQIAASIVAQSTGQPLPVIQAKLEKPKKNPAAVALGRLGGLKGGRARAESLSKRRKREIAKKAATIRWSKH